MLDLSELKHSHFGNKRGVFCYTTSVRGVAQLVARTAGGREVAGSSPVTPTNRGVFMSQNTAASQFFPQGECMQILCDGELRTPGEAYAEYVRQREEAGLPELDYYFSTTITTGGFLRDPNRDFVEGMTMNHQLARAVGLAVVDRYDLDEKTVLLPSDLGKVAGWSQSDFLLFWVHVLRGSEPEGAIEQDERFQTDHYLSLTGVMSNKGFSEQLRRQAYVDMIESMRAILNEPQYPLGIHNRPQLVPLIDTNLSLGCYAERVWAKYWRHPVSLIEVAKGLSPADARLLRQAKLLGVNVLGQAYNRDSAQKWADYYGDMLVEDIPSVDAA